MSDVVRELWAHRVLLVEELQVVVKGDTAGAIVKLHNVVVDNLTRLLLKQLNDSGPHGLGNMGPALDEFC